MIHNALDWVRLLNTILAAVTVFSTAQVLWRVWPGMEWYRRVFLEGCGVAFFALFYGSAESILDSVPYGLRIFFSTIGLTLAVFGSFAWARHLPRRKLVHKNRSR